MPSKSTEAVKRWFKETHNALFILILVFSFLVRLYFFVNAYNQPLWWDEAEYMATAKHWAFGVPYDINPQRPPLFQLAAVPFLWFGLGEGSLKFFLVILPSVCTIGLIYFVGRELFGKRIALIATAASSVVWSFLFWSIRFQPDFFSLSFQLLSVLFFWKTFKEGKKSFAILTGLFIALAFYFKISALLVPLSFLIFIVLKDGFLFIKNKNYWIIFLSFLISLIPFGLWQYVLFGNPVAFAPSYIGGTGIGQGWALGWMVLKFFYQFPKPLFFILFLAGIVLSLLHLGLSADLYLKNKERRLDPSLFSLILLLVMACFYIFYIRGIIEDRWVFLMVPFIMYFSAKGLDMIAEKTRQLHPRAPLVAILLALIFLAYVQVQHAHSLIEVKKTSYLPVKEASLWIKQNSVPGDTILSNSYTQATAYAERKILPYPALIRNESDRYSFMPSKKEMLDELVKDNHPKYLMVSVFERHPDWTQDWLNENQPRLKPVQAYFSDAQKTQAILIVYEISYV